MPRVPRVDAFGREAFDVADAATEWIDAAQAEGVLCFASAFPGGGPVTEVLTGVPTVRASDDALYASDLVPFRAAFDAGVAGVLIAEASYTALDAFEVRALLVLSRPLLRAQLGFMASPSRMRRRWRRAWGHCVGAADLVGAGIDLVLRPVNVDVELRALIDAMERGTLDGERVHEAAHRRRVRAEMAGVPEPEPNAASDDHAWLDDAWRADDLRVTWPQCSDSRPGRALPCRGRADQVVSVATGFASGIGEAAETRRAFGASSRRRRSCARRSSWSSCRPPACRRCEQDVAALCTEARRLGRESVVVWCAHPAMSFAGDSASLTIACWSATVGMLRAAGRWLVRRV